jgi:NAD(P)H-hydrate epimerase
MIHDVSRTPLPKLPRRQPDTHKGTFGRVLVIGGSLGMAGSVGLTGQAALRSGAGLVYVAVPKAIQATVASYEPSYLTIGLEDDPAGSIDKCARHGIRDKLEAMDVLAVGPGMAHSDAAEMLVNWLYLEISKPIVLDAGALHNLAQSEIMTRQAPGPRILTPHPGEFALLTDRKVSEVQSHRRELATAYAQRYGVILVLKGHQTIITDGQRLAVNTTGNPGMATGGTGDVLTGLIAALVGQGLDPFDAARLGTHIHGLAGDLAAVELGEISLIASDLVKYLPKAFLKLSEA